MVPRVRAPGLGTCSKCKQRPRLLIQAGRPRDSGAGAQPSVVELPAHQVMVMPAREITRNAASWCKLIGNNFALPSSCGEKKYLIAVLLSECTLQLLEGV